MTKQINEKPFNIIKAEYPEFYGWLKQISRYGEVENHIILDYKNGIGVTFYTKDNQYHISARLPNEFRKHVIKEDKNGKVVSESNEPINGGYLGCIVQTRKPRAGENWTRGNDLPDGKYSEETWRDIVNAIVAYELVKVVKPKEELEKVSEEVARVAEIEQRGKDAREKRMREQDPVFKSKE